MSEKTWADEAWDDYLYWQTQDKKTLKRINLLIKDIERNGPLEGRLHSFQWNGVVSTINSALIQYE